MDGVWQVNSIPVENIWGRNFLSTWCKGLLFQIWLYGHYCDTNILITIMYGLEKLKENLRDFSVVMPDRIHKSQTRSFSTGLLLYLF